MTEPLTTRIARWRRLPLPGRRTALALLVFLGLTLVAFDSLIAPQELHQSAILATADYAGYTVCHRLTDHSFVFAGRQMPLCARCSGMYLGIALVFVVLLVAGRTRWTELPPLTVLLTFGLFLGLMGIDGLNSYSGFFPNGPLLYEPKNWLRLATGMGTGLGMGTVAFPALAQTLWKRQIRQPSISGWRELFGLILLAVVVVLLVLSNQTTLLYVLSLVSAVSVVAILTTLNTVLMLLIMRREGLAEHWYQAVAPLSIGLCLALAQIAAVSYVRYALTGTMTGFPGL